MSETTNLTIPETVNFHPAEDDTIRVDFGKNLAAGETLVSATAEVQSQQSTADPLPVPNLGTVTVQGTAALVPLVLPEVDRYELLIVATTSADAKKAVVLNVNVALR